MRSSVLQTPPWQEQPSPFFAPFLVASTARCAGEGLVVSPALVLQSPLQKGACG